MSWTRGNTSLLGPVSSGNISVRDPAGSTTGDLIVVRIKFRGSALFTVPSPWEIVAQIGGDDVEGTSGLCGVLLAYKIDDASTRTTYTFTRTGGGVAGGNIEAFRASPGPIYIGPSSSNQMALAGTTATTGALVTDRDGALIVGEAAVFGDFVTSRKGADVFSGFDAANFGTPSGATSDPTTLVDNQFYETREFATTTGANCTAADFCVVQGTGGDTGAISATMTVSQRATMAVAAFYDRQHANVEGQMLTYSISVIAGEASAQIVAGNVTLTAAVSLIAGTPAAVSIGDGDTLTATTSLLAGSATGGAAEVGGVTLSVAAEFYPGDVSSESECTVVTDPVISGSTVVLSLLTATPAVFGGVCALGEDGSAAGDLLTIGPTLIPGVASVITSPLGIPDIVYWYDPSDSGSLTLVSSAVSQMNDLSGSGYHVTQSTAANRPALGTINGVQALDFDGTTDELSVIGTYEFNAQDAPFTFVFVAKYDSVSATASVFSLNNNDPLPNATDAYWLSPSSGYWSFFERVSTGSATITGGGADTNPHIFTVVSDGTTTTLRVDGCPVATGNTDLLSPYLLNRLTLGAYKRQAGVVSQRFDGKLGEFTGFNRAITSTEYGDLETYLSAKWGITLGSVTANPATTLTVTTSLTPGYVPDRQVTGPTLTVTTTFIPGTASQLSSDAPSNVLTLSGVPLTLGSTYLTLGTPTTTVSGSILPMTVSLIPGSATGERITNHTFDAETPTFDATDHTFDE